MNHKGINLKPVILIGAARSGTKILRDLISLSPSIARVPYDVNYIWRIGNEKTGDDEFSTGEASPEIAGRIRKKIESLNPDTNYFIEKTVSNCLRVNCVDQVFPNAKYIHLVRRGEDVIDSAFRQWLAPPDLKYILRKGMSFPLLDAFGYGISYVRKAIARMLPNGVRSPGVWGPHYRGIEKDLEEKSVLEVCAIQWLRCLEKATRDLLMFDSERVIWIRYEEFVQHPEHHLKRIAYFIGIDPSQYESTTIQESVRTSNIGKGRKNLTPKQQMIIRPYVQQGERLLADPTVAQKFATW